MVFSLFALTGCASVKTTNSLNLSWQVMAVEPNKCIDAEINLEGWLYMQEGVEGKVGDLYLFESSEALKYGLKSRSIKIDKKSVFALFGGESVALPKLKQLKGSLIVIRGIFQISVDSYFLGEIKEVDKLENNPYDLLN